MSISVVVSAYSAQVSVCVCVWSVMSDSASPWTVAHQAPLSMRFPRQESWRWLSFRTPGDLPNSGTKPASPDEGGSFTTTPQGSPSLSVATCNPICASGQPVPHLPLPHLPWARLLDHWEQHKHFQDTTARWTRSGLEVRPKAREDRRPSSRPEVPWSTSRGSATTSAAVSPQTR